MAGNILLPLLLSAGTARDNAKPQPQNGDVLRVNRGLYSHYGVYAADSNHVIHYTGATGPADFNGIVRETTLEEFLNGAESFDVCRFPESPQMFTAPNNGQHKIFQLWRMLRNMRMKDYHLYSGDEAVERARSRLGQGGYNLAFNNCEHFAVWCRTGVKESSQVSNILDVITYLMG